MKLKVIAIVSCFLLATGMVNAQDQNVAKDKRNQHQIGVNATYFFKQFLNFGNNNTLAISPYIISYKVFDRKHHGFRFGAGLSMQSTKENPDSLNSVKNSVSTYNFRAGYEFQKELGNKWICFFGVDGLFNYSIDKTNSFNGFDNVTNEDLLYTYGGGPIFGIQYNISKHITLFTETGIYALTGQSVSKSTFESNPSFNDESKTSVTNVSFLLPTSLYLNVRF
jgi:hypothetical protein